MKKVLLVSALVLTIVTSMVSGTLAVYNIKLATVAEGPVVAANFVLTGAGDTSFSTKLLIAPSETVSKVFTVSNMNADGSIISEVSMDLVITVKFVAADGKDIIVPLTAVLKNLDGTIISSDTTKGGTGISLTNGAGTLGIADVLTNMDGETKTYIVDITWPDDAGLIDPALYADHGTKLIVTVDGTQQT